MARDLKTIYEEVKKDRDSLHPIARKAAEEAHSSGKNEKETHLHIARAVNDHMYKIHKSKDTAAGIMNRVDRAEKHSQKHLAALKKSAS